MSTENDSQSCVGRSVDHENCRCQLSAAFIDGANWFAVRKTGTEMWQDDEDAAKNAAIDQFGLSEDRKNELRQVVEDHSELMKRLADK